MRAGTNVLGALAGMLISLVGFEAEPPVEEELLVKAEAIVDCILDAMLPFLESE